MKILIAGATGLIGTELVSLCQQEEIEVNYLTTSKSKLKKNKLYNGYYWNPENGAIDEQAFSGVTAIVNLAGESIAQRWTAKNRQAIIDSRIKSTNLLYETLGRIDHEVSHYISASGVSVYPSSMDHLYEEDFPEVAKTFLGEVVEQWEMAADQFKSLNIEVSKLRTGVVLSVEGGALPKLMKPIKMGFGAAVGSGMQWQSWIHITDVAKMYVFILQNKLSGIYNAVSPNPVTNKKMTQILADHFNKSIWLPPIPEFMIRLLLGKMAAVVLESQLVCAQKIINEGFQFQFVNLEHAVEDLL